MKRILYVEDDKTLSFLTSDSLRMHGYDVVVCENGEEGWEQFQKGTIDLCVLDVMLPQMDGFTLAKKIREMNADVPILFLTAKTLVEDKISGLKIGGDDYIVKPFSMEELLLKIDIFLKRSKKTENRNENEFQLGKFVFQLQQLKLKGPKKLHKLTSREADLLHFFIQHKNELVKREEILKALWGSDDYFLGRSLDVFISRLRKYFIEDQRIKLENVHGVGFILQVKE